MTALGVTRGRGSKTLGYTGHKPCRSSCISGTCPWLKMLNVVKYEVMESLGNEIDKTQHTDIWTDVWSKISVL